MKLPARSSSLNAYAERFVRTIKSECLAQLIPLGEEHLLLLTKLLVDGLKRSRSGRVVNLTSSAQAISKLRLDDINFNRRFYYIMRAYGGSKHAIRLFTAKLAHELEGTSVCVNSYDPGLVRTSIGSKRVVGIERVAWRLVKLFSGDAQKAADFIVYIGTSRELSGVSGMCFTARRSVAAIPDPRDERLAQELWDLSCAMSTLATH